MNVIVLNIIIYNV